MTFLTRRALDRRTLLRGSAAALGVPLLSAMTPAATRPAAGPLRLVFVYVPNGVIGDAWQIDDEGPLGTLPRTLAPLQAHAEHLRIVSGLTHDKGRANGDGPGDHARAAATWLTGCQPYKGDGTRLSVGPSVDQVAAEVLGRTTRLASLSLGAEGGRLSGQCDSGYPCAYSNSISWRTPHTPIPKETDPGRLFDRLVGGVRPGETQEQRAERLATRASVLDLVSADARRLSGSLGAQDRSKLDDYLDAIRSVEARVRRLAQDGPATLAGVDRPDERPDGHGERAALLFELLALALETDATRVATMMIADEGSNRSYRVVDVRGGHHGLSHHRGDEKKVEDLRRINRHHAELFAPFVARLAASEEDGAPLLDRCAVVYGSSLGDGNRHTHHDLPVAIAGRLGGAIGTGVHVRHRRETPMTNLFLTLLDTVGVHRERLGDSTGRLALGRSV